MRPLLILVLFLLAGCGGDEAGGEALAAPETRPWTEGLWEKAAATDEASLRYHALPGAEGFSELPARVRAVALAAAHQELCPCGCSHSVAYCLNEHQGCLVCPIRAAEIVAEAAKRYGEAAEEPAGGAQEGAPDQEPPPGNGASPGGPKELTDSTKDPPADPPGDEGEELKRP